MKKYFKNFILCGEINFHCLLCTESFTAVEDLEKHIRWENHRKAMKNQTYFHKYKKDNIYKIGKIFYCELCNFAIDTFNEIRNHINEENHKMYKTDPEKIPSKNILHIRVKTGKYTFIIINNGDTCLTNEEWNGIVKKHCTLCNEDIQDVSQHLGITKHILKLIACKTFADKDVYYRKYDNNMIYCFTCKKSFTQDELSDHFAKEHSPEAKAEKKEKSKLFDVDHENLTAICRTCNSTMKYTFSSLYNHKKMHFGKSNSEEDIDEDLKPFLYKDGGKRRAELKEFGKNNYIKLNHQGSKGYCSLCDMFISAHIYNYKEHVNGKIHTKHLEMKGILKKSSKPERFPYKLKPAKDVFKEMYMIKSSDAVVINSEVIVKKYSFLFLLPLNDKKKYKCFLCDEVISFTDITHYKPNSVHFEKLLAAKIVVTSNGELIKGKETKRAELIREVKLGMYHCGLCNQVYPGWDLVERHFDNWKHKNAAMEAHQVFEDALESEFNLTDNDCFNLIDTLDLE